MTDRTVILELIPEEAEHLTGLVTQFAELLTETTDAASPRASGSASAGAETDDSVPDDPAVARLVPDAYADDPDAAKEFRGLTQRDLLDRRSEDAARVLALLQDAVKTQPSDHRSSAEARTTVVLRLDNDDAHALMRTLAAVRLVLASRLGIVAEDDHDEDDPRFGIYDWLGYRLDGLVRSVETSD